MSAQAGHAGDARIEEAAQLLLKTRKSRGRIENLPESCRPADLETGFAVQRRVTELLGQPIGAWKVSLPPPGKWFLAPVYGPTVSSSSPYPVEAHGTGIANIEPEIAFVLGRDLDPRGTPYSEAEVRGAVAEARLVLEILGARYTAPGDKTFPEQLADGLNNQGLFVGPVLANAFDRPLEAFHVTIQGPDGVLLEKDGKHPTGHPFPPVVWLAEFLNARGMGLKKGQIITTGSYAGVVDVPVGVPLVVKYGDLGSVAVQFSAA